ncbi:WASH complex subunit 5 [Phlebotomus argentipes]|uniref:WASH complex subunit 5 n=1 Tax=Phlebotomus argentipes TaxID=94469 RepID=UPI002892A107|nr:WASH complex subunit 5 [Phlebotomus argentipes]
MLNVKSADWIMAEFLAENNVCGRNLLQITALGNAIIAELLRLKDYIPDVFRLSTKEEQTKYAEIILDFRYFKISDVQDQKIENDETLQDLDNEFRDNNIEILTRFYLAFESVHQYVVDLKTFIQEVNDGIYIQQSLESILQDDEGKQLLCESLYLYGVMLLVLDLHIPGVIRERLLVSYHRYSAQKSHGESHLDDVCKLLRSTGFSNAPGAKKVPNYPEDYFRRVSLDEMFVEMVIGRLRSDDVYNQIAVYPLPEHRSTALANQAGMLYVCLFFSPATLQQQPSRMREIVDKFFSDNWIVSIYMGITVNLIDSWGAYRAAKAALNNTIEAQILKEIASKHEKLIQRLLKQSRELLSEGVLSDKYLIANTVRVINAIRECNVTLRWLILHTVDPVIDCSGNKRCRAAREQAIQDSGYKAVEVFELLLNTSQLELRVRDILKELLCEKEKRWDGYKFEAGDRLRELSEVFAGAKTLTKIEKNENLRKWFSDIHQEIEKLDNKAPNVCGRKIVQLIQALEEVQEFHSLDTNMQVKQLLIEVRDYLHQMIHTINIKEDALINLQLIGDLSYAWKIVDKYTPIMQEHIKKSPSLVIKLRATFLKLASALEIPLLRINQAKSEDLISVSQYYSNELVDYVRKVVQIIPQTIFYILSQIVSLQTNTIREIPTRLEKDKLKEYAQLEERFEVARLTYTLSVFTEGILMMKKTLVGVIELDPKQLLEDGIRKELVRNLSNALHETLSFSPKIKPGELEQKLVELTKVIDGYRRSFEYVQDYLNIQGLKFWQEEMSRIINYNVEKECNSFLRSKVQDWQSIYQNPIIPIPVMPPTDATSVNFIGRLGREILRQTDPQNTVYVEVQTAWYDIRTQKEGINLKFFPKIIGAIGPPGLLGLDKLYAFTIVTELQQLLATMDRNIFREKIWLDTLTSFAEEISGPSIANPGKFYPNYINRCVKIWPKILDWVLKIGQKQILRRHIGYEINICCAFNSKNLESSLRTMNDALLTEIRAHEIDPERPYPSAELLSELNKYLEAAGICNPLDKIYVITKNSAHFAQFLFLLVISHLAKMQFVKNLATLMAKKQSEQIDGAPFITGIVTILRQFHPKITDLFLQYLCQYIVSYIEAGIKVKSEFSSEALIAVHFLEAFIRTTNIPRASVIKHIPALILNQYEYLSTKV